MNTTTRHPATRSHIRNHRTAVATIALFATFAAAGCVDTDRDGDASGALPGVAEPLAAGAAGDPPPIDTAAVGETDEPVEQSDDAAEDAADLLDDSAPPPAGPPPAPEPPGDGGEGGGDEPIDLDPVEPGDTQPAHPCDSLVADGSSLAVGPDPLVLEQGDLTGSISIFNCSDGDIDWTAKTKPSVSLDDSGANLLPGEEAELDFTIDGDQWDPGAVDFKIKVSEPGHNHYVDVHAFRQLSGKDFVADVGLTAGPGAGGCANQCILSALLAPNMSTPNLGIDITTNTEATIRTWVSTAAPVEVDGAPTFPGESPTDVSLPGVTSHQGVLAPLEAATKYHIVVAATDSFDHTSYRSGSFTTITPLDNPDGLTAAGDPPGCAAQCVTKAQLTAGADHTSNYISIATHTAARIQVAVSTDAPTWSNGVPSFAETDVWLPSGLEYITEWDTDIEGLAPSTGYHIIVSAIDANDHADHRVGQFHTAAAPTFDVVFSVLDIHVDNDGDKGINRGELRFGWRVGENHAGNRDEDKISTGSTVNFPASSSSFVAHGVDEWLPTVIIQATERDADGLVEFCSMGNGVASQYGNNGDCDIVWNVAVSGLYTLDTLTGAPRCTDLGYEDANPEDRCLTLSTFGAPGGYPEITANVAVHVVD